MGGGLYNLFAHLCQPICSLPACLPAFSSLFISLIYLFKSEGLQDRKWRGGTLLNLLRSQKPWPQSTEGKLLWENYPGGLTKSGLNHSLPFEWTNSALCVSSFFFFLAP